MHRYIKSFKIGDVHMDNNLVLAPMAGVADGPFRKLCKEQGAGLVYSEMISAKGLCYEDVKSASLARVHEGESPLVHQIFGYEPEIMARSAENKVFFRGDIIDINMGCPTPKITSSNQGSALMKDLKTAEKIIRAVVEVSEKPVTVKIRKGWDEASANGIEMALMAQESGVSAIAVHGRTRDQFYGGRVDLDIIRQIKDKLRIPVIGNGDVFSIDDGIRMFEYTGCDALMIGRGAMGNPWIFSSLLGGGGRPEKREIFNTINRHLHMLVEEKGEYQGVREMRKHVAWYIKGFQNCAAVKDKIFKTSRREEMLEILELFLSD